MLLKGKIMIYHDEESNQDFTCYLEDDGTMDTVISINGIEYRYDGEYCCDFRDEDGSMTEDGFFALIEETLSDCWEEITANHD